VIRALQQGHLLIEGSEEGILKKVWKAKEMDEAVVKAVDVRKTLKLKFLFYFIYFHSVEPKHNFKCSQNDHRNNNSHM